ncbi:MAG: hypothetical protein LBU22_15260 [Dysgonamonadaceae bacterium]|jgi:C-terminal processing protease CtpA/Prc|nr:hypothetical protein [Dysgonamonadaceae bacterium]
MKRIIFILLFFTSFSVFAEQKLPIMYSNKVNIKLIIESGENGWTITPSLNPDRLELYSETEKVKNIQFISDVDSIAFQVKINQPVAFAIVLNQQDTAHVLINFTNKIPHTLTDEDKIYALSLFWNEAKYNFVFIDRITFDIDSLYRAYIPKVLATTTDYDFYKQMELFAASFKDLHTESGYRYRSNYTDYISLLVRYFDNDLYIVRSTKLMNNIYPVGSKILKINGLPVDEYMQNQIEPYINSHFKETIKSLSASRLLASDLPSNKITLTYQTPDGRILTNTPPRNGKNNTDEPVGYSPEYWEKPIEIEWKKNNIAHLKFNTFNREETLIPLFEKMKDTLYSANGIIIDLRQNSGGSTATAWHLLQYMIRDSFFLNFAWQTRINNGVKRANGNYIKENEDFLKNKAYQTFPADTIFISDTIKRFEAPIVVLISNNTCSAAEDFLIILAERKNRPLFIGQPTMGSTGSPLVLWDFPDNGKARICTRRVLYPYSLKPFNEGIYPDIPVEYNLAEFLNPDYDKDLELAVEELNKQINK